MSARRAASTVSVGLSADRRFGRRDLGGERLVAQDASNPTQEIVIGAKVAQHPRLADRDRRLKGLVAPGVGRAACRAGGLRFGSRRLGGGRSAACDSAAGASAVCGSAVCDGGLVVTVLALGCSRAGLRVVSLARPSS